MPLFRFAVDAALSHGLRVFHSENNFDEWRMNEHGEHFVHVFIAEMRKVDSSYNSYDDLALAVSLLKTQYSHVNVRSESPIAGGETPIMVFSKVQLGALSRNRK